MIPVEVVNSFLVSTGKEFVILLKSKVDERTLPISIGQLEAQSIAIALNNLPFPRPLTHDLFKNVLTEINCTLTSAIINDLTDETFYARLNIESNGVTKEIDSRPSDAIAMALRFNAPIFVDEKVMDAAGVVVSEQSDDTEPDEEENNAPELSPLETLQKQLEKAINEERYEDAAKIRDEINRMN
ncbi:MAG: bifunctional nuclease domain-containing protein [Fibrobacterota bacterium]|nr:bifunctional nuclease family protein [Chitinispirillaceae bacterium]